MDYKRHFRDLKLDLISNKVDIKLNPPKVGGFFSLRPGDKVVKDLLNSGAILTGSRALKLYTFNGKPLLDRKADDWDFIVNEETMFKICEKHNEGDINIKDGDYYVRIRKQKIRITQSYGGAIRILPTNITLIVKDEPDFNQTKNGKVASLLHILEEKYKLSSHYSNLTIQSGAWMYDDNKHDEDLKKIIIRLNG